MKKCTFALAALSAISFAVTARASAREVRFVVLKK